jgi:hypothetical protein
MEKMKRKCKMLVSNLEGNRSLRRLNIYRRIILKGILKKLDVRM